MIKSYLIGVLGLIVLTAGLALWGPERCELQQVGTECTPHPKLQNK